jgi:hypothetical protein
MVDDHETAPVAPAQGAGRSVQGRVQSWRGRRQFERHGFGLPLCIGGGSRRAFRHVAAITANEPLPFAADMQNREVAGTKRGAFDGKAALFVLCEPVRNRLELLFGHREDRRGFSKKPVITFQKTKAGTMPGQLSEGIY